MSTYTQENLEKRYIHNLNIFKNYMPHIYERLIKEKDNSYSFALKNGELDLLKDNQSIYPNMNIKQYHSELVEAYNKRDKLNLISYDTFAVKEDDSLDHFGIETLNISSLMELTNNYKELFNHMPNLSRLDPYHDERYSMIIFGIGLGYHIPELIMTHKVQQLVLVDINIEMLRASLYTLNWEYIFSYFAQKDQFKTMMFIIDGDPITLKDQVISYFYHTLPFAYYNLAQFVTYNNPLIKEAIKKITTNITLSIGSKQGFYDDEKWSLQHTINNLRFGIPLLSKSNIKVDKSTPIFLIANGPSLDLYIDYIKENKDKAIIFAAGSSLESLYKNDIKPHFFIDIERSIISYEIIKEFAPKEYLEDVIFFGMNNIHPRVFTLFKKGYIFSKPLDAGTSFIDDLEKYPALRFSNPTVSNGAMALSLFFGFRNICLFGMDFGYKSADKHHSKSSMYHNEDSAFFKEEYTDSLKVKGVDGGLIYTQSVYDDSRKNIENIIEEFKTKNPQDEINIYNFSQGAHIEGTVVPKIDTKILDNYEPIDKNRLYNTLLAIDKNFSIYNEEIKIDYKAIEESIDKIIDVANSCKLEKIDAFTYLRLTKVIFDAIRINLDSHFYVLKMVQGTSIHILSRIYTFTAFQEQDENSTKFIHNSLDTFTKFLKNVKKQLWLWDNSIDSPYYDGINLQKK